MIVARNSHVLCVGMIYIYICIYYFVYFCLTTCVCGCLCLQVFVQRHSHIIVIDLFIRMIDYFSH